MDLAWSKHHIDTFVIVSGDCDFSPLVSKLKENGKHVIGLGVKDSTSDLLRDNCDEFIYYEDLERGAQPRRPQLRRPPNKKTGRGLQPADRLVHALQRENNEVLWASMIKDTMKRKKPSFNESYYGYRSFTDLLEDAAQQHHQLKKDQRSGTYIVTGFATGKEAPASTRR